MLWVRTVLLAVLTAPAIAAASGSVDVVRTLSNGLEDVLHQADHLDYAARYQQLAPILDGAFDFGFMARQAVGRQWNELSSADQQRWVASFRELTTATYASRFNRSAGQHFEVSGEQPAAHDTVTVRSRVIEPGAEPVDLTYRLRQIDGRWKVIDVYLKGSVSEVALRRSEFASVLKRQGFEELLAAVRRRIAALAAGNSEAR